MNSTTTTTAFPRTYNATLQHLPLPHLLLENYIRIATLDLRQADGRKDRAGDTAADEDPKYNGCANVLRERVERECGDDSTTFTARG